MRKGKKMEIKLVSIELIVCLFIWFAYHFCIPVNKILNDVFSLVIADRSFITQHSTHS